MQAKSVHEMRRTTKASSSEKGHRVLQVCTRYKASGDDRVVAKGYQRGSNILLVYCLLELLQQSEAYNCSGFWGFSL